MKVLIVNSEANLGGAERCLLDCMQVLKDQIAEFQTQSILFNDGPLRTELEKLGIPTTVIPMPDSIAKLGDFPKGRGFSSFPLSTITSLASSLPKLSSFLIKFRQEVRRISPALIHSHGLKSHLLTAYSGIQSPVIWHIHDFLNQRPLISKLLKFSSSNLKNKTLVAVSKAIADDLGLIFHGTEKRVVYNGIDINEFCPGVIKTALLDNLAGMPESDPNTVRIGLVSTYARWKGHRVFLEAARKILNTQLKSTMRFYIIGGPIYRTQNSQFSREELEAIAREFGIGENVGFIPFQNKIAPVYRELDIVVHASTRPEPFGRTIVEGMACGKTVIATKTGGAVELFQDGVDAIGIRPGNHEELAAVISKLVAHPELRANLGAQGRRRSHLFSHQYLAKAMSHLYRGILGLESSAMSN